MGKTARQRLFGERGGQFAELIKSTNRYTNVTISAEIQDELPYLVEPFERACQTYLNSADCQSLGRLDRKLLGEPDDEAIRHVSWVIFSHAVFLELLSLKESDISEETWTLFLTAARNVDPRTANFKLPVGPAPELLKGALSAISGDTTMAVPVRHNAGTW